MRDLRRPSLESLLVAAAFATVGLVGGWAAGAWDAPRAPPTHAPPTHAPNYGPAPESDALAGVADACSRRIGCLVR